MEAIALLGVMAALSAVWLKSIRPEFNEQEYEMLTQEADELGISLKQLVRDQALKIVTGDTPLSKAKILSGEISKCREVLNRIIKREIDSNEHLYEDDIIRIEMAMHELEEIVTVFVRDQLREAKRYG